MVSTAVNKSLGFGLASGVITTLGLLVGLSAGTGSQIAAISGVLVIAIADSLSDAFGMHVSEESQSSSTHKHVWKVTLYTLISKLTFALSFVIPLMLFPLTTALWIDIAWGTLLLGIFSVYLAHIRKRKAFPIILEHLVIGVVVIGSSHLIGKIVSLLV